MAIHIPSLRNSLLSTRRNRNIYTRGHIDIPRPCVWERLHRECGKDKTHTFAPFRTITTKKEVATHCDLFLSRAVDEA